MPSSHKKHSAKKAQPMMFTTNQELCETCVWTVENPLLPVYESAAIESALIFPKENGPLVALFGTGFHQSATDEDEDEDTVAASFLDVALMVRMAAMIVTHPTALAEVNPKLATPRVIGIASVQAEQMILRESESEPACEELSLLDGPLTCGGELLRGNRGSSLQSAKAKTFKYGPPEVSVYHAILMGDTDDAIQALVGVPNSRGQDRKADGYLNYIIGCFLTGDVTSLRYLLTCPYTDKKAVARVLGLKSYKDPFPSANPGGAEDDDDDDYSSATIDSDEEDEDGDSSSGGSSSHSSRSSKSSHLASRDPTLFTTIYERTAEQQALNGVKVVLFLLNLQNKRFDHLFYPRVFCPSHPLAVQSFAGWDKTQMEQHAAQMAETMVAAAADGGPTAHCRSLTVQYNNVDVAWYCDRVTMMLLKGDMVEGIEWDETFNSVGYPSSGVGAEGSGGDGENRWWERPKKSLHRFQLQRIAIDLCPAEGRFWMNMNCLMDKDDTVELKIPPPADSAAAAAAGGGGGYISKVLTRKEILIRSIELAPKDFGGYSDLAAALSRGETVEVRPTEGGPLEKMDRYQLLAVCVERAEDVDELYEYNDADEYQLAKIQDYCMAVNLDDLRFFLAIEDPSAQDTLDIASHIKQFVAAAETSMEVICLMPIFMFRLACLFLELGENEEEGKNERSVLAAHAPFRKAIDGFLKEHVIPTMVNKDANLVRHVTRFVLHSLALEGRLPEVLQERDDPACPTIRQKRSRGAESV
ncbi:MAG: hypothetical protein COB65_01625, partial [Thalassobium sp.]